MATLIPVDKHGWLDYQGKIYLIRTYKESGNEADFQFDGTLCKQGSVGGFVVASFESKNKYFNSDYWYKKTAWGKEYPDKVYFKTNKRDLYSYFEKTGKAYEDGLKRYEALWAKEQAEADAQARPAENILKSIIRAAVKASGMKLMFPYKDTAYGNNWYEAYVPLTDEKGDRYLLTWENCD
jgi:hypothetical protein